MLSEKSIENGLRRHEFVLHYQPKISLLTGKVVGAEALVRWEHPGRLTVPPSEFIPVAEQSSLINRMTEYIVSALADQIRCAGRRITIPLSFNASARDLEDPSVVNHILGTITREGIDPRILEIEITESHALANGTQVFENMARLGEAGIALTMDDYGTGYSIPDSLSKWPFTTISLDQGIIGRMLSSKKNATIVRSSIRLAHELNLKVIAEGIETVDQYQFLLESGCYLGQGFLISRPVPFAAFLEFADRQAAKPGSPVGLINMAMLDHIEWRKAIVSYALKRAALPPASTKRREYDHADLSPTRVSFGKWYTCRGRKPSSYAFFLRATFTSAPPPQNRRPYRQTDQGGCAKRGNQQDHHGPQRLLGEPAGCAGIT